MRIEETTLKAGNQPNPECRKFYSTLGALLLLNWKTVHKHLKKLYPDIMDGPCSSLVSKKPSAKVSFFPKQSRNSELCTRF